MNKKKSNLDELTILGKPAKPSKKLEAFPNEYRDRYYVITIETDEFTCLCPVTGQPDFADITVEYVPDEKVVESKSLKLYYWSYRNQGIFHEEVVNKILDDLVKALDPHWCKVIGVFNARGGLGITVETEHTKTPDAVPEFF
ncbi:MAG: NADPH-dependent 7-cyano-7-deazaguanine reductase QueF [candidate division Zixibacteria bacterium]|nr:NADPH-dependent 7-cyano-7-deazaguanine reductase QueF [candidate division Zixibacteria bacterium]